MATEKVKAPVTVGSRVRWSNRKHTRIAGQQYVTHSYGKVRKLRDDGYVTVAAEPDGRILLIDLSMLSVVTEEGKVVGGKQVALPPGLAEFAEADGLNDAQVERLAEAWNTIRGYQPKNLAEWREFYKPIRQYFEEVK